MPGSELKANSRKLIFDNAPRIFFISLLYVAFSYSLSWLSFRLPGNIDLQSMYDRLSAGEMFSPQMIYSNFRLAGIFLAVLLSVFHPIFDVGFMSYCLKINRRQNTDYKDILNGFVYFLKIISLFAIISLYIFLWSLLFIIPGIIASYKYRLAFYILLDNPDKGVFQCINESAGIMYGAKVDLFILDFSFLGWYLLDTAIFMLSPFSFTFPVVFIWLYPYMGLTRVGFYEERINTLAV